MRVAVLLCGQMRTFDHPKVIEYTNKLIEQFNCDVFLSTWKDRGVSMQTIRSQDHSLYNMEEVREITEKDIKIFKNVKDFIISDYNYYLNNICDDSIRSLLISWYNDKNFSLCMSSNPEFYTMHLASKMKTKYEEENNFVYDVVIRSRPDFLHLHTDDIEKYFSDLINTCYHINIGKTYSPERVYPMFLISDSKTMDKLCRAWEDYNIISSTNHSIHIYSKYDACRLMYAQCIENNIQIKTFDRVIGDCFRIENYSDYEFFKNWYS